MGSQESFGQFDDVHITGEFVDTLKPDAARSITQKVLNEGSQRFKGVEVEKTIIERHIIDIVRNEAEKVARMYAKRFVFEMSDESVHVLKRDGVKELTNREYAIARPSRRQILIDRDNSMLQFATDLFHEFMHILAHNSVTFEAHAPKEVFVDSKNSGFIMMSRDKNSGYDFEKLDEGLIGYLTKRFYIQVLSKNEFFQDDTYAVAKLEHPIFIGRKEEVRLLGVLMDFIWHNHDPQFATVEDVWEVFLRARFSGDFAPARSLVENTFGEGSFDKLGKGDIKFFRKYIRKFKKTGAE